MQVYGGRFLRESRLHGGMGHDWAVVSALLLLVPYPGTVDQKGKTLM